ncbi:hypothetical protein BaRGS_00020915 [Batillaria attramentaria]|uniref:Uncharacterized protein n=1 Tax=Batillaria attramentaria TaxID=370345 RepID=A0ABD0KKW3_9CAEN
MFGPEERHDLTSGRSVRFELAARLLLPFWLSDLGFVVVNFAGRAPLNALRCGSFRLRLEDNYDVRISTKQRVCLPSDVAGYLETVAHATLSSKAMDAIPLETVFIAYTSPVRSISVGRSSSCNTCSGPGRASLDDLSLIKRSRRQRCERSTQKSHQQQEAPWTPQLLC